MSVSVKFHHGLGDASNFARLHPVYKNHGIELTVECTPDKKFIFDCVGTKIVENADQRHDWWIPIQQINTINGSSVGWSGNKSGENLRHYGLMKDGILPSMDQLWAELKKVDLQCFDLISSEHWSKIDKIIQDWPKPLVLWHSIGNTNQSAKSFSKNDQDKFLYELIEKTNGTIILLDWDNRVSWTKNHRIKHLMVEFGNVNLPELAALMYRSDLLIGIDSGPFYFSALTDIPSVGIFFDGMHPSKYMIPTSRALSFSTGGEADKFDPSKRFEFQIIRSNNDMGYIAKWCSKMLESRKYLPTEVTIAADVQLQQIVQEKCRGNGATNGISSIYDRNRSFDILLRECQNRFTSPIFVETGCIRSDEDWGGAGFSTALFGRYCHLTKGYLTSFDLSESNVAYARQWCRQFGDAVDIQCIKGEDGLRSFRKKIDVLYLDSLDTGCEGHQECNLAEFKAAEDKLSEKAIVVIDDTPSMNDGKGGLTCKYMVEKGWKFLYSGYQVVLSRLIL